MHAKQWAIRVSDRAPRMTTTKTMFFGTFQEAKSEAVKLWNSTHRTVTVCSGEFETYFYLRISAIDPYKPENGASMLDRNSVPYLESRIA